MNGWKDLIEAKDAHWVHNLTWEFHGVFKVGLFNGDEILEVKTFHYFDDMDMNIYHLMVPPGWNVKVRVFRGNISVNITGSTKLTS